MMRTFFALLPTKAEQNSIAKRFSPDNPLAQWLDNQDTDAKKVRQLNKPFQSLRGSHVAAANLHVTLVFLGLTTSAQLTQLTRQCRGLNSAKISLSFNYLSYWHKPRIICLRPKTIPQELTHLQQQLAGIVQQAGIAVDARSYKPHITLLRKARQVDKLNSANLSETSVLANDLDCQPITISFSQFHLMQSTSTKKGVIYTPLHSFEFR